MKAIIGLLLLGFAPAALADAPFCLVSQYGYSQCLYYNLQACQSAARSMGGMCAANVQQQQPQVQVQPYVAPQPYQQVQPNYADAFARGWQQGEQMKRDRQRANLEKLASIYYAGGVSYEGRSKFLADVAKNGGDAAWYRNDMEARDAQERASNPPPPPPPTPAAGQTFSYFPEPAPSEQTNAQQAEIDRLKAQLAAAQAQLKNTQQTTRSTEAPSGGLATSDGTVEIKTRPDGTTYMLCGYTFEGRTITKPVVGTTCPAHILVP